MLKDLAGGLDDVSRRGFLSTTALSLLGVGALPMFDGLLLFCRPAVGLPMGSGPCLGSMKPAEAPLFPPPIATWAGSVGLRLPAISDIHAPIEGCLIVPRRT